MVPAPSPKDETAASFAGVGGSAGVAPSVTVGSGGASPIVVTDTAQPESSRRVDAPPRAGAAGLVAPVVPTGVSGSADRTGLGVGVGGLLGRVVPAFCSAVRSVAI